MRGKHNPIRMEGNQNGLIPAYAGKTLGMRIAESGTAAHPRVCGENILRIAHQACLPGSSPRMRGKQSGAGFEPRFLRLIPAYAGKTPDR